MTIVEDMAQKEGKHIAKHEYWKKEGVEIKRLPLPVGDYVIYNDKVEEVVIRKEGRNIPVKKLDLLGTYSVTVDSKYGIEELCADICGPQHERFRDECILAQNNGIRLIILVENEGGPVCKQKPNIVNKDVNEVRDLAHWINPRLFVRTRYGQKYPNAVRGLQLMKAVITMNLKYGVEFAFCRPGEAGKKILELLRQKNETDL
jgi:ribosome-associated protein